MEGDLLDVYVDAKDTLPSPVNDRSFTCDLEQEITSPMSVSNNSTYLEEDSSSFLDSTQNSAATDDGCSPQTSPGDVIPTAGDYDVDSDASDEDYDTDDAEPKGNDEAAGNVTELPVIEANAEGQFIPPDDDIVLALANQIEELFSDASLMKESYLLKHIRRNKLGFVSLKVINSLRKVKRLTRDYRAIAYAVKQHSSLLELNETETKVRRKDALTHPVLPATLKQEEEVSSEQRTVVAINLPSDKPPSVASVGDLFSSCGSITQIRIIPSGGTVSGNIGKLLAKHIAVGDGNCALIEFELMSDAKKACKKMTNMTDWRHGMRVTLLVPSSKKLDANGNSNPRIVVSERGDSGNEIDSDHRCGGIGKPPKKTKKKKLNTRVDQLSRAEGVSSSGGSIYSSSGSETEGRSRSGSWRANRTESPGGSDSGSMRRRPGSPKSSGASRNSPLLIALHSGYKGQRESESEDWRTRSGSFGSYLEGNQSRVQSPWALKRLKAQQETIGVSGGSAGSLTTCSDSVPGTVSTTRMSAVQDSDRIVRLPRGPDGTLGFKFKRQAKTNGDNHKVI